VSKAYGRYWSVIWFGLACPVPIAAIVVWSWVGVASMTMVALLLGSVIFGNPHPDARGRRGATRRIPWRLILVPAFRWAVIAVAVVLTTVFSPWLGVLVLTALVGSSPWAVRRMRGSSSRDDDLSRDHIREAVRQLDLAGLCWAWRSSHELLARIHDVDARTRVVTLRQEYLDEMERRDARGFHEWLEVARGASDPEVFLTEGRDGGAAAA
jgi:hypothetical protein